MKKFLAFTVAGIMMLSAAGCGKKVEEAVNDTVEQVKDTASDAKDKVEDKADEAKDKAEDVKDEVVESAGEVKDIIARAPEDYDFVNSGVGVMLPDGFTAEQYSGSTSIIRTDNDAGTLMFSKDYITVDENNDFYGHGYEKADSEGVEAADIEPFKAGKYNWVGYTFDTMLFGDYWHYVNLVTEEDKDGQKLSVLLHSGTGDETWYDLDSEEVQYILSNMDFVD